MQRDKLMNDDLFLQFCMKKYALIVAAGSGSRMGSEIPKQFMLLQGIPLFMHAAHVFLNMDENFEIILLIPQNLNHDLNVFLKNAIGSNPIKVVAGGHSRFETVKIGLQYIPNDSMVFIHDAVRPFINRLLIQSLSNTAKAHGCAIPAIDLTDSIRYVDEQKNVMVERKFYKAVQTPQVFLSKGIKEAYHAAPHSDFTDDASVYENNGSQIFLCEGLKENIKITFQEDFAWAEFRLSKKSE